MKKKIIVTGGAGFIGSCLVKYLNEQGLDTLLIVDNLANSEKWKNLVGKRFDDVIHKDTLFDYLKTSSDDIQAIFHLGACSSTVETNANYLLENNYRYTRRLAEYAVSKGIRFIYASSAATYGDGLQGFSDDEALLETLCPLNMYGYSKHLFDLYAKKSGLLNQIVVLKYFNVFGPNEYHKGRMSSHIVRMVPQVIEKGVIELFESDDVEKIPHGGQRRDFVYVKDVARMTAAFLENTATGVFNVGAGYAASWNELAACVCKALGKETSIRYIPMPQDLKGKYQDFTLADMAKTKKALKEYAQSSSLESAVEEYVNDYLMKNERW